MSTGGQRLVRRLGIVVLILLSGLGVASVALLALGLLIAPVRTSMGIGRNSIVWAFSGIAFRPLAPRTDTTGWRVAYVLANKEHTLVLSALRAGLGVSSQNGLNGLVTLADTRGHAYAEQPGDDFAPLGNVSGQFYAVTVFPPLQPGTSALFVHHNASAGGTAYVPINLARIASAPQPIHPNLIRRSGRVSVTIATITRGALLSQVDISARGFIDPGGEVTRLGNNGMMQRPPQVPAVVIMRTVSGRDLAPQIGVGPVDKGTVTTSIGFRTPPRGTVVTLIIDNYELTDLPPQRRTTRGHWAFTFTMP